MAKYTAGELGLRNTRRWPLSSTWNALMTLGLIRWAALRMEAQSRPFNRREAGVHAISGYRGVETP